MAIMCRKATHILVLLFAILANVTIAYAQEHPEAQHDAEVHEGLDMTHLIFHHVLDSYQWDIVGWEDENGVEQKLSIPLPIIAYHDGQFLFALSSSFKDGATLQEGALTWHMGVPEGRVVEKLLVSTPYEKDVRPTLDLSITRNVASMWLSVIVILVIFVSASRAYKKSLVPHGAVGAVEACVLFVKEIADEQIGEKSAKYVPYMLSLFFFIWINNIIGLIPFFPFSTNLSGNIAFTATLAVGTFILTNFNATKHYWVHNFTVPGVPFVMKFILVPIEIVTMFIRPFTLLVRLFANVTGGHIIILSLIAMIFIIGHIAMAVPSILLTLIIFVLEIIFGALQAYIFTLLSALYIGLAVNDEH
ncbi:MAG: F0F1 ATP synthase subunit A [Bacteroidia bacterium]|nr:F0F1 ATP synthase subunit A [Bacteroidia bacterium]